MGRDPHGPGLGGTMGGGGWRVHGAAGAGESDGLRGDQSPWGWWAGAGVPCPWSRWSGVGVPCPWGEVCSAALSRQGEVPGRARSRPPGGAVGVRVYTVYTVRAVHTVCGCASQNAARPGAGATRGQRTHCHAHTHTRVHRVLQRTRRYIRHNDPWGSCLRGMPGPLSPNLIPPVP